MGVVAHRKLFVYITKNRPYYELLHCIALFEFEFLRKIICEQNYSFNSKQLTPLRSKFFQSLLQPFVFANEPILRVGKCSVTDVSGGTCPKDLLDISLIATCSSYISQLVF